MKLAQLLELYRRKKKLTYRKLAAQIGVNHAQLFRLLTKESGTMDIHTWVPLMNWMVGK